MLTAQNWIISWPQGSPGFSRCPWGHWIKWAQVCQLDGTFLWGLRFVSRSDWIISWPYGFPGFCQCPKGYLIQWAWIWHLEGTFLWGPHFVNRSNWIISWPQGSPGPRDSWIQWFRIWQLEDTFLRGRAILLTAQIWLLVGPRAFPGRMWRPQRSDVPMSRSGAERAFLLLRIAFEDIYTLRAAI